MARERSIVSISSVRVRRSIKPIACSPYRPACLTHSPSMPSVLPPPRAPPKNTSKMGHWTNACCARDCRAATKLLDARRQQIFFLPFLTAQFWWHFGHIALRLLSLDFGGGFSVDSVCHLCDRPGLAIQRTFGELFSNAPHLADALRIVLVNRLCEHNSQLISELLFTRQPA